MGTTGIPKADRFSGAFGGRRILLCFFTAYEMVTPALVAICRVACHQSSKYVCSISGLSDIDFTFSGVLCRFIDSTGLLVPGSSFQSSESRALYALHSFLRI